MIDDEATLQENVVRWKLCPSIWFVGLVPLLPKYSWDIAKDSQNTPKMVVCAWKRKPLPDMCSPFDCLVNWKKPTCKLKKSVKLGKIEKCIPSFHEKELLPPFALSRSKGKEEWKKIVIPSSHEILPPSTTGNWCVRGRKEFFFPPFCKNTLAFAWRKIVQKE